MVRSPDWEIRVDIIIGPQAVEKGHLLETEISFPLVS